MKNRKLFFIVFVLVCLIIVSGCDGGQEEISQQVGTLVAGTMEAKSQVETMIAQMMTEAAAEAIPTTSPTESPTLSLFPTPTPSLMPTLTATAETSTAFVEVTAPTNCRTGPGKIYDRVSILDVNEKVEIVARNAEWTYWVVKSPDGSGTCWLWDKYAVVTGQTADLPVWSAPPTPTPQASEMPSTTGAILTVSVPTNCRVGPGKAYDKVSVLEPDQAVKVIARDEASDYWVVENPEGSGNCWVWGYYATITGSTAGVPVWAPPTTPTPTKVALTVSVDTYCRSGPGKKYDIITIMRTGKTAEVVGRNYDETYWVIQNPDSSGQCWVWGYYADVTGPASGLPVWEIPPTPTPTSTKKP